MADPSESQVRTDGNETITEWHDDQGELHREDGPAEILEMHRDDVLIWRRETWFAHGKKHRTDGPAVMTMSWRQGELDERREEWFADGVRHRSDGPAEVSIRTASETGDEYEALVAYHVDGKSHRVDGPAWVQRSYQRGQVVGERWDCLLYTSPSPRDRG